MAQGDGALYNEFKEELLLGNIDMDGHTFKVMLVKKPRSDDPTKFGNEISEYRNMAGQAADQIGTVAGQSAMSVYMPGGATYVDFPVKGLVEGETEIYLQRAQDYAKNATVGITNYIKRKITVTTASVKTVSIRMTSSGTPSTSAVPFTTLVNSTPSLDWSSCRR